MRTMSTKKRQHELKYNDMSELSAAEAAAVIAENSGHAVRPDYLSRLVRQGRIVGARRIGRINIYPYPSVRDVVISADSPGRPRKQGPISGRSEYIREYRRRLRQEGRLDTAEYQRDYRRRKREENERKTGH